MDWVTIRNQAVAFGKRYWYVLVIVLAGMLLMSIPESNEEDPTPTAVLSSQTEPDLQQELESILSQIQGAGKVCVLLTEAYGERTVYQTDDDISADGGTRSQTVIITGSDRDQAGLVYRVDPPGYLGAVVVCQGGGSAAVRLAIVEAVSNATGLSADKITVLKMK